MQNIEARENGLSTALGKDFIKKKKKYNICVDSQKFYTVHGFKNVEM